jgi:hypothetical protein
MNCLADNTTSGQLDFDSCTLPVLHGNEIFRQTVEMGQKMG